MVYGIFQDLFLYYLGIARSSEDLNKLLLDLFLAKHLLLQDLDKTVSGLGKISSGLTANKILQDRTKILLKYFVFLYIVHELEPKKWVTSGCLLSRKI